MSHITNPIKYYVIESVPGKYLMNTTLYTNNIRSAKRFKTMEAVKKYVRDVLEKQLGIKNVQGYYEACYIQDSIEIIDAFKL